MQNNLAPNSSQIWIAPISGAALEDVRELQALSLQRPQIQIDTEHVIHAGMYARTIKLPASTFLTGALIKVPTILIISGDVTLYIDRNNGVRIKGENNVLPADAPRMQALFAHTEVSMTMMFATNSKSVEEIEKALTDEAHLLFSHRENNNNLTKITGEYLCPVE